MSSMDQKYIPEKLPTERELATAARDVNHPANPDHPQHHHWVSTILKKFGNAAITGAGMTFGADMVNDALRKF